MSDKPKKPTALSAYKRTEILTASREMLLLMMYQGATRFLKHGIELSKKNDVDESRVQVGRALDIVNELRSSLNFKVGEDIAENLEALYGFVIERLVMGNIQNKTELLEEALGILNTLQSAWQEAINSLNLKSTQP